MAHGVFHFRHNDVCALDSLRTVRRPSVLKCAKYSTMCFWRQLQRSRRVHCKGCWRFITGYAPTQVEGRSIISRDHPVRLENPDNFILCPQDAQNTTAKSTLHFLDTEAKQAMFKAFQNLGRIEPQFDAADPS